MWRITTYLNVKTWPSSSIEIMRDGEPFFSPPS
jgi:hypothetical protein